MTNSTIDFLTTTATQNTSVTWSLYIIILSVPFIYTYQLRRSVSDSLIISGFVTTILNALLWTTGLMNWDIAVTPLPLLIFGFVMKYFQDQ